jgi:hypothetical protein
MKTYKAYLQQEGEGCDYTIGCGLRVIDITANSMEEAKHKLAETIATEYSYDEGMLYAAELYEVEQVFSMDVKAIYQKVVDDRNAEKQREKDAKEKAEFERLKSKFGA